MQATRTFVATAADVEAAVTLYVRAVEDAHARLQEFYWQDSEMPYRLRITRGADRVEFTMIGESFGTTVIVWREVSPATPVVVVDDSNLAADQVLKRLAGYMGEERPGLE